ncbi:MAG TPA: hypothetical protein PKM21_09165 [Anaerolineales bacterium]|nr:hypothetical protein [Anaerolineales bacterium]
MRTVQTFILRLLVDSDHPDAVRGALQAANEAGEPLPFRDASALLLLLKRLAAEQALAKPAASDNS